MNRNADIPEEELETIERYILEQMPREEYDAFTAKMQNDASLQNKVKSVRLLIIGVQEASLNNKVEEFHRDYFSSKKNEDKPRDKVIVMKRWLLAASVIVIASLGVLLFLNQSTKNEKLFSAYYKPDTGLISAMSISDNYLFDHAMIDYKTGDYAKAISSWENLLIANPLNDTLNYFLGSAYLAMDKSTKAIGYFKKVTTQPASYFFKDACWYTGLALLKSNKKKEAISFIEKSNHPNKDALLLKLKEE